MGGVSVEDEEWARGEGAWTRRPCHAGRGFSSARKHPSIDGRVLREWDLFWVGIVVGGSENVERFWIFGIRVLRVLGHFLRSA